MIETRQDPMAGLAGSIDHYDPLFLSERVDFYAWLHAHKCPVRRSSRYGGFWFIDDYSVAQEVQRRVQDFTNEQLVVPRRAVPPLIPANLSHPDHLPVKIALAKLFTPAAAARQLPRLAEIVRGRISDGVMRGSFDIVQDVMFPVMAEFTLVDLLGLDAVSENDYVRPIRNFSRRDYPPEKVREELEWLNAELSRIIIDRQYDPGSVLGQIARIEVEGKLFTDEELLKIAFNLLFGGVGTSSFFTGSMVVFLGRNPEYRRQLIDNTALIPEAVDELLRMYTPTQTIARQVARDLEFHGFDLKQGDMVLMGYGACNFDPAIFAKPSVADFTRSPNKHMAFGTGSHRCLGQHVALAIQHTVLDILLALAPDYVVEENGVVAEHHSSSMFGYCNVPLSVLTGADRVAPTVR